MSEKNEALLDLVESIVGDLSKETISKMAEKQLKEILESYTVTSHIEQALRPVITKVVVEVAETESFKKQIEMVVTDRMLSLIEPAVKQTLSELVSTLATSK